MATLERDVIDDEPEALSFFRLFVVLLRFLFDLLLLALVVFVIGFLVFVHGIPRNQQAPARSADGISVLTGGPSRIDQAMKLLASGKAKRLLITGVNRTTSTEALKDLASQGDQFFACCVDIDKEAKNTIDNATETSQWAALNHYNSIIIVTSNYHMPRALAEHARVMPNVTLVPYAVVDKQLHLERWWNYPGTSRLLLSEYVKYLPALGRLGATQLVSKLLSGKTTEAVEDASEP
jgi:uncharacterized SAM-binding protein YcdF (DUF218 family)